MQPWSIYTVKEKKKITGKSPPYCRIEKCPCWKNGQLDWLWMYLSTDGKNCSRAVAICIYSTSVQFHGLCVSYVGIWLLQVHVHTTYIHNIISRACTVLPYSARCAASQWSENDRSLFFFACKSPRIRVKGRGKIKYKNIAAWDTNARTM